MRKISVVIFFLLFVTATYAQELNCTVIINHEKVQTTEKTIFQDMQSEITNFLNNTRWTNDVFAPAERIKCNIEITLISGNVPEGQYSGTLQIRSSRPVYGTDYESILLNFLDKEFAFTYLPSQPIYFNENTYLSDITSVLGYFAYIIIGLDYDSFSSLGGTPYYEKARNVLNAAMFSGVGWSEKESNGRYWLSENLNHQQMVPLREGLYKYHRLAMDNFIDNPDEGRKIIMEFLQTVKQVNINKPASLIVRTYFLAKAPELIQLFSKGDIKVRTEAASLLKQLDPLNSDKYNEILR